MQRPKTLPNAANGGHLTQFLSSTNCNSEGGGKRFYTLSFSEKKNTTFCFLFHAPNAKWQLLGKVSLLLLKSFFFLQRLFSA